MFDRPFEEIERESWSQRAANYDRLFGAVSMQAIAPILDSIGDLSQKRLLDVACGTGHLVAAAQRLGAMSEGVDFVSEMVDAARANYPGSVFKVADAVQLPYDDNSFDAVTCAFGLPHMPSPLAAAREAFRVLKPGGRFAFTLWFGAERGGELQAIVNAALQAHATATTVLPPSWTVMRFADEAACETLVSQSGFLAPQFHTLAISGQLKAAREIMDFLDKMSLRTATVLAAQPTAVRARIQAHILREAEARRGENGIVLAWPALLTIARKPA